MFLKFVRKKLCPILGDLSLLMRRSVVMMDNASVHMDPRVKEEINKKGAYLLYGAPYSPDLNPIEKMFSVYKAHLKRHENLEWTERHDLALAAVSPRIARNFFRKCQVPMVESVCDETVSVAAFAAPMCVFLFNLNLN